MTARVAYGERARRTLIALAWVALYLAVGFLVWWVLNRINPVSIRSPWRNASIWLSGCAAFGLATWLVGVRLGREPWDHWGWPLAHPGIARPWMRGLGLGVLMAALTVGLAFVAGRARVWVTGEWSAYAAVAAPFALLLLVAALFEELVFRGYPLRRLADAVGPWAATAVFATGFALAHLGNPAAGVFGIANVALAGVWLSFAFFSPAGMPFAWGLHFGWNAGLALLFDAPVSGHRFFLPAVEYAPGRHAWVDGGAFGPEGGIVATIVLIAGTLAVLGGRLHCGLGIADCGLKGPHTQSAIRNPKSAIPKDRLV